MTLSHAASLLLAAILAAPAGAAAVTPTPAAAAKPAAAPKSSGSAISREELKKALEANPDLVLAALKKADKSKFFEIVVEGQQEYQKKKMADDAKREETERENAFKNPLKPVIGANDRQRGNKDAPITIVEYSDFQCPYCGAGYKNLEQLRKLHGDKMRVVFKNFPLNFHPLAMPAAQWFEALALQNPEKAWAFHDMMFENQSKLGEDYFKAVTKDLGLDVKKAEKDAKSEAVAKKIEADMVEAKSFGIEGTPAYLINGVPLRGAYPVEAFEKIIAKFAAK